MFYNILSKPIFRLSVVILVNENLIKVVPLLDRNISHRHFARWSTRKPSSVSMPEDAMSESLSTQEFSEFDYGDSKSDSKKSPMYAKEKIETNSHQQKKKSSSDQLDYQTLEEHHSIFSNLMTKVCNRKMREKNNLIMLEGKRLNMDALQAGLRPTNLFFTRKSVMEELNLPPTLKVPLYKLPYKTVRLWSKLEAPPGLFGFYKIPNSKNIVPKDTLPIKVLCDNVRDPGNLGSIIRVAASAGCTQVLLMKGCTDPWDSKVLRAASGGHFHIPISMDLSWNKEDDFLQDSDDIFLADSHSIRGQNDDLQLESYHNANFSECKSVVVVIGGETEGLSNEALRLAAHHRGSRLYIPLSNCMESLNSGCALSVILFEIKRQFLVNGFVNKDEKEYLSDSDEIIISPRCSKQSN